MNYQMRILVVLAFTLLLVTQLAMAQKPPAPPPPQPSPSPSPGRLPSSPFPNSDPTQRTQDRVMILMGRIATDDGTPVPYDAVVERVCNNRVRQQAHTSVGGDFSFELGSKIDSVVDASGDGPSRDTRADKNSLMGISRYELANCELRASISGFRSNTIQLFSLTPSGSTVDVGPIVVHRTTKAKGMTLSARIYKAPPNARKAYEKGLEAEEKGKLAEAGNYFEQAARIYPAFTYAWYQLGIVLQKQDLADAARKAHFQATTIDTKFLPPYLSLAFMAYKEKNWAEVLVLTGHILDLDPLNHVTGYILDLDELDYAEAYFYNAVASYKLNKFENAEKSGLKAERLDLRSRFPQVHLLMAQIFARKNNYSTAISEVQTYLELTPHAKDVTPVREWLAELKKLDASVVASEKPDQK